MCLADKKPFLLLSVKLKNDVAAQNIKPNGIPVEKCRFIAWLKDEKKGNSLKWTILSYAESIGGVVSPSNYSHIKLSH